MRIKSRAKRATTSLVVVTALASSASYLQPWSLGKLIDGTTICSIRPDLFLLCTTTLWALLTSLKSYMGHRAEALITYDKRRELEKIARTSELDDQAITTMASYPSNISIDTKRIGDGIATISMTATSGLVTLIAASLILFELGADIALFSISFVLIASLWLAWFVPRTRRFSQYRQDQDAWVVHSASRYGDNYLIHRSKNPHNLYDDEAKRATRKSRSASMRLALYRAAVDIVPNYLFSTAPTFVVLYCYIRYVPSGEMTTGSIISLFTTISMAIGPIQSISSLSPICQDIRSAERRINPLKTLRLDDTRNLGESHIRSISASALVCSYENERAFRAVSFFLKPGDLLYLTGKSGSGKSTFLRCIAGLKQPNSGAFEIDSSTPIKVGTNDHRSIVAYCSQHQDTLNLPLKYRTALLKGRDSLVDLMLADIYDRAEGIDDDATSMELSGGQRQRLLVAETILSDRPILIFDEPMSGQDDFNASLISRLIQSETSKIVLLSTHRPINIIHPKETLKKLSLDI